MGRRRIVISIGAFTVHPVLHVKRMGASFNPDYAGGTFPNLSHLSQ